MIRSTNKLPAVIAKFFPSSVLEGEFENNSRNFTLLSPIYYHSAKYFNPRTNSYVWVAESGITIDGASIPQVCWSVVGGPYSGSYRRSAAIHDQLCATEGYYGEVSSQRTHALFAEMIEAEGVSGWKLKAMSLAVKLGGPKW